MLVGLRSSMTLSCLLGAEPQVSGLEYLPGLDLTRLVEVASQSVIGRQFGEFMSREIFKNYASN